MNLEMIKMVQKVLKTIDGIIKDIKYFDYLVQNNG